jgi:hypothetical protein
MVPGPVPVWYVTVGTVNAGETPDELLATVDPLAAAFAKGGGTQAPGIHVHHPPGDINDLRGFAWCCIAWTLWKHTTPVWQCSLLSILFGPRGARWQ